MFKKRTLHKILAVFTAGQFLLSSTFSLNFLIFAQESSQSATVETQSPTPPTVTPIPPTPTTALPTQTPETTIPPTPTILPTISPLPQTASESSLLKNKQVKHSLKGEMDLYFDHDDFQAKENPTFIITFPASPKTTTIPPTPTPTIASSSASLFHNFIFSLAKPVFAQESNQATISAKVLNKDRKEISIPTKITQIGQNTFSIDLEKGNSFEPGIFTLVVQNGSDSISQDFTWGVLAINVDKSIYLPNEKSDIQIAVLDETGKTVCDASLELKIQTKNSGGSDILSTENGKIKINSECQAHDVTQKPDYEALYQVGGADTYQMALTAKTKNGTYTISDSFEVKNEVPFDVQRDGPTRIYPPNSYPVTFKIIANQDFDGTVIETVPASFDTTPALHNRSYDSVETQKDVKVLKWQMSVKKGDQFTLGYDFKAPAISPQFYLLGPLKIGDFTETRQWQIAADASTITRIQAITCTNAGATTISCTVTAPANNNALIAVIGTRGTAVGQVSSITQTGATWAKVVEVANANADTSEVWAALNVSGAGTAITINLAASLKASAIIAEYSGIAAASATDLTASATGSSVSPVTGTTTTTTQASELWVGGLNAAGTSTYSTPLNAFTLVANAISTGGNGNSRNNAEYLEKIVTTTGTANSGATLSATQQWAGVIATFKAGNPTFNQSAYRLFNNLDSTDVGTALAAQDTAATLGSTGVAFRLRMLLHIGTDKLLASDQQFKLQFAQRGADNLCDTAFSGETYADVTAATVIAYKNNVTPADGATLTANVNDPTHGTDTIVNQTYEELNNFTNSVAAIPSGQDGKWDFSLFDNGATANTTYCLRAVKSDGTVLNTYTVVPQITTAPANLAPNSPTTLTQKKVTGGATLATGDWTNETQVQFTASATDPNNPDTLQLCVEKKPLGTAFANTEDACGTGVAYSGTAVTVSVTITALTDATEYHWQARIKDAAAAYSAWVSYPDPTPNLESARDFGVDTTAPTGGIVYDGTTTGVDAQFNDGSLSALSANWSGFNANVSGLLRYDYAIGTTAGGTDVVTWTSNGVATSVTVSTLTLKTSKIYYVSVRAVDNAGNIQTGVSSDGQVVAPTLTFSFTPTSITFLNLNTGNSYTDTQNTTITTSTNAYNGYVVRLFTTQNLTSTIYPSTTIGGFTGGTYAVPAVYAGGDTGFGVTSSDSLVQGVNKFAPSGGVGTLYFAPSHTGAGDIIADNPGLITGTPITNEAFTITYKTVVSQTQAASPYTTTAVYTTTPQY